jgi:hypothetical protein
MGWEAGLPGLAVLGAATAIGLGLGVCVVSALRDKRDTPIPSPLGTSSARLRVHAVLVRRAPNVTPDWPIRRDLPINCTDQLATQQVGFVATVFWCWAAHNTYVKGFDLGIVSFLTVMMAGANGFAHATSEKKTWRRQQVKRSLQWATAAYTHRALTAPAAEARLWLLVGDDGLSLRVRGSQLPPGPGLG